CESAGAGLRRLQLVREAADAGTSGTNDSCTVEAPARTCGMGEANTGTAASSACAPGHTWTWKVFGSHEPNPFQSRAARAGGALLNQ
ncbi:unnamed protein product, partial [Symbiodinium pilosum]